MSTPAENAKRKQEPSPTDPTPKSANSPLNTPEALRHYPPLVGAAGYRRATGRPMRPYPRSRWTHLPTAAQNAAPSSPETIVRTPNEAAAKTPCWNPVFARNSPHLTIKQPIWDRTVPMQNLIFKKKPHKDT